MKELNNADVFAEEEKREEKSKKAEEKRVYKEEMTLLKEKERVEKEELKMKAKIGKEQVKGRHRVDEEEKRKPREKGKARDVPLVVDTEDAAAAAGMQTERLVSLPGQTAAVAARRASTGSLESLKDSSDEEERPMTSKSTEGNAMVSPRSPSKRQSKVKSWFAGKFHSSNKTAKDGDDPDANKPSFIGGASLTGASSTAGGGGNRSRDESMRDVAIAGKLPPVHPIVTKPQSERSVSPVDESRGTKANDSSSISTLSDSGEQLSGKKGKRRRGRLGFKDRLLGKTNTKSLNDTDEEEFEEARDTFEEEKLAPPPKLTAASVTSKPSASPVRDSKFSEIL